MERIQAQRRKYTVEEYMALEAQRGVRHEFLRAKYSRCRAGLRGRPCRTFFEDVQLTVEQGRY